MSKLVTNEELQRMGISEQIKYAYAHYGEVGGKTIRFRDQPNIDQNKKELEAIWQIMMKQHRKIKKRNKTG